MEQLLERLRMSFSLKPHPLELEAPDLLLRWSSFVLRWKPAWGMMGAAESSAGDMGGSAVAERLDDRLEQIRPLSTSRRALLTSRSIQRSSLPSPSHLSSLRLRRRPTSTLATGGLFSTAPLPELRPSSLNSCCRFEAPAHNFGSVREYLH